MVGTLSSDSRGVRQPLCHPEVLAEAPGQLTIANTCPEERASLLSEAGGAGAERLEAAPVTGLWKRRAARFTGTCISHAGASCPSEPGCVHVAMANIKNV